ncbi:MAG: acetoin utilization protein AcuB3, partial [Deltaproteobacteria bacterium]
MLVENWMSKTVVTVGQNESLLDAMRLLEQKAVSMLPVLEGEEVVGIVT